MLIASLVTVRVSPALGSGGAEQSGPDNGTVPETARPSTPQLARVARALADERRAELALTLIDGRAWTPTELAVQHRWPRSSVTEHLNVLLDAGLVSDVRQGKHRYVRLANAEVAELIERLAAFSAFASPTTSLRSHRRNERLREGRTCYHHLAGRLGIRLRDGFLRSGLVNSVNGYTLTPAGTLWFEELGYPVRPHGMSDRRATVRPCLDWTERVDHLAGIAADTLCFALTDLGWIKRSDQDRAVQITAAGTCGLVDLGVLAAAAQPTS